jgi:hypothetical protein
MPCYLFTWHAYGTWMPDRPQGYVKKGKGILPPDAEEAERYRSRQKEAAARFDDAVQQLIIEELVITADKRRFRLHGVATDSTHDHVLLSWPDERTYEQLNRGVRESITRRLNQHHCRRWLVHKGSRKRVEDRQHFDYLMKKYLPKHTGWKWREGVGVYR